MAQAKPKNKAGYDATAAAADYKNYGQYKKRARIIRRELWPE
jgi:hypothetical protein